MDSFDATYRRHYQSLYRYIYRYFGQSAPSEDVVQEAFLKLYRQRQKRPVENEKAWLYRVATNTALSQLGRQQRWQKLLPRYKASMPQNEDTADPLVKAETVALLQQALSRLSKRDRVLLMLFQEEMSYKEMAEVTGIKPTSVGKLLARAMQRCAKELENAS